MILRCVKGKKYWVASRGAAAEQVPHPRRFGPKVSRKPTANRRKLFGQEMGTRGSGWHLERDGIWKERRIWRGQVKLFW